MAFTVAVAEEVIDYIRKCDGLTVFDQDRILLGLDEELSKDADKFLARNTHPLQPTLYWYDYTLMTEAKVVREFRFWCNAEGHVYGVTEVQYVDEYLEQQDQVD